MSDSVNGETISIKNGTLQVPDHPIIPFIEGDGTGPDIWRASVRVLTRRRQGLRRQAANRLEGGAGRPEGLRLRPRTGCPRRPSRRSGSIWSASRDP